MLTYESLEGLQSPQITHAVRAAPLALGRLIELRVEADQVVGFGARVAQDDLAALLTHLAVVLVVRLAMEHNYTSQSPSQMYVKNVLIKDINTKSVLIKDTQQRVCSSNISIQRMYSSKTPMLTMCSSKTPMLSCNNDTT